MTTIVDGTTGVSLVQDGVVVQADLAASLYSEGTWVPTLSAFGGTGLTASGSYTKIGRLVFANIIIDGTAVTSASGSSYASMPLTPMVNTTGSATNGIFSVVGGCVAIVTGRVYTTNTFASTTQIIMTVLFQI